jgi:hypothetical protein
MILLNQVIQVLVGPDERLSGQDAFGLQFGDGLVGRLTAVRTENSILAVKSPFSDDAAPISSSN